MPSKHKDFKDNYSTDFGGAPKSSPLNRMANKKPLPPAESQRNSRHQDQNHLNKHREQKPTKDADSSSASSASSAGSHARTRANTHTTDIAALTAELQAFKDEFDDETDALGARTRAMSDSLDRVEEVMVRLKDQAHEARKLKGWQFHGSGGR